MKTSLQNKDSFTRSLDVVIPWKSLEKDYMNEFNIQRKKFKIPGFRPGKVPIDIVKREIGAAIDANFSEQSLNKYYQAALMDLKIIPINQAQITKLEFKEKSDRFKGQGNVNAGIYLFEKPILGQIPSGKNISVEKDVFPSMIGKNFYGFKTTERLFDIGTPQRLEILRSHIKLTD